MRKMKVDEYTDNNGKGDDFVKTIAVVVNPEDNGGESVTLSVDVYDNGDKTDNIYTNTRLEAMCYGVSSSSITLWGVGFEALAEAVDKIKARLSMLKEKS